MAPLLPVTLLGHNLGQRHRHLNCLVREAKESGASFLDVAAQHEESAVDRLFKIDLATKLKHVDYILSNLKDDDMLYVSRALKATWLIGHHDIINPKYLDEALFPEMITPAVSKMKHWLYINLRDPATCQEFYQHHKENTFEFALKFLSHCSREFILAETPKILTKLSAHSLRVLCEKCPTIAKIYFDSLATDEDVKTRYLGQERSYYNSVKCVLKSDADVFLDITEKYFNVNVFSRFSPSATDYILRSHKSRFTNKVELYTAYILHIPTLAARLSVEECQEVVLKLARASYLKRWFEYKVVEPLIKRLSPDKRAAFKKLVSVDKDVGDCEDKWPYEIPAPPTHPEIGLHFFDDQDFITRISPIYSPRSCADVLYDAAATFAAVQPLRSLNYMKMIRVKSELDKLFDDFRFIGFERALHELGQRLGATGSTDRRRDIFLVLVSKTGGRTDAVSALLRLAARHSNEPAHTRASILRSLVKRANVWRLPADVWQHLLDYGHGLGLDGAPPEAACREGLHAVVIRQLLAGECEQAVRVAFMEDFSTLVEYSLNVDERLQVANGLQNMLTDATIDVEPGVAAERLQLLLNVLKIYRVRVDPTSPAVKAVVTLASRDAAAARPLLQRLYDERIARRELMRLNMEFRRDEAALLNALRHDPAVLELDRLADILGHWHCWQSNFGTFTPRPPSVFGSFSTQLMNDGSSTAHPFVFGNSAPPPPALTGFSFGSSAVQPSVEGNSGAPPTGFSSSSSAAQPSVEGNSAALQTDFSIGSSVAPPTSFGFGNSAAQSTEFGSPTTHLTVDGNCVDQPMACDSSTDQPTVDSSSANQSLVFSSSTVQKTAFGSSAVQQTAFDSYAVQPISYRAHSSRPKRYRLNGARQANFDRFTSKLVLYFDQKQDLATRLHTTLKDRVSQGQNVKLARPLASLFRNEFEKEMCLYDAAGKEFMKFVAALRASAHRARPIVNLAEWGWSKAGVKAVATRAMRCRERDRAALTRALAAERRTMAPLLPVTLLGHNLGQRHRHLNCLVREAKESGASFLDVAAQHEESAVDRLFKIDLATKIKHVDYILSNLKDDDMLYVSRALKATWLIGHHDIINPKYLDEALFPEMITPAVSKMKHWLYINLRDPATCQEFYLHYKENTFEFALKFLSHCSQEFILAEAPKILTKLSAHSLKVLCEKCPTVAKIYFDSLATDEDLKTRYLDQDRSYYNSVKCVLKSDADVFLDITEKYFNMNSFSRFSPLATDYILRSHKARFTNKMELYTAYILHIPTLAARLSVEECQEVVLKLARASYLKQWFEYKVVEPLIKRLSPDKRAAFKKLVFVDKDIGDCEDKWPYETPAPPTYSDNSLHIFDDQDFMSSISPGIPCQPCGGMLFGASANICAMQPLALNYMNMIRVKTELDRLFDEFRFIGFERALHELGQRLGATGSTDRRRDIFLVLVSKTGGRTDAVSALLRLAARHSNEPAHTRASILRSLVKRANVWRLPADVWQHLLDYGHGLGLDGAPPEAACREGLHAVVIRQLLAGECEQAVRVAFMEDFSTLVEYSLNVDERLQVANGLQNMLTGATIDVEPGVAAERLQQLLNVLKIYHVRVEPTSPAVKAVVTLASRDAAAARPLLQRLYDERIARRELMRLNMEFRQDEAALLNALRHDPAFLELEGLADILSRWHCWQSNFRRFNPPVFGSFSAQSLNCGRSTVPLPVAPTGFSFGSFATQPSIEGNSAAPPTGFHFDSSAAQPTVEGNSAATPTGFHFDGSAAQPTVEGNSAAPPTGFHFDSSATQPMVEGNTAATPTGFHFDGSAAQPMVVRNTAAPPTGFHFDSSAAKPTVEGNTAATPTGFHFDSSATQPVVVRNTAATPTGFHFDSSAIQPMVIRNTAAPPTGFHFDGSAIQPMVIRNTAAPPTGFHFDSSAAQPMVVRNTAAPPTGFHFDSSAIQPMVIRNTAAPPTGFHFDGSAIQPMVIRNTAAPPTGFHFDSSAIQPMVIRNTAAPPTGFHFDSSAIQPMVIKNTAAPPTGFHFDGSAAQPMVVRNTAAPPTGYHFDSSAAQPTDEGNSTATPTGFHFDSSATQSMVVGNTAAPPTGFHFVSSATQSMVVGNTAATPTGFHFDSSATQSMVVGNTAAPPTGFHFDSSATQSMVVGNTAATPTGFHFDSSATQSMVVGNTAAPPTSFHFGSSAAKTSIEGNSFGSSAAQPLVGGNSASPQTGFGFGSSAAPPTGFGFDSSAVHSTEFGRPTAQVTDFDSSAVQSTAFGSSVVQPTPFGSSAVHPVALGRSAVHPMAYGSSAVQPTSYRAPLFRPKRHRLHGPRQTNFDRFTSKLVIYFDQKQDLTTNLQNTLKKRVTQGQNFKLARPLASLFRKEFEKEMCIYDAAGKEFMKFVAALRACAHRARPIVNLAEWGWSKAGVKAVATRAMRCRERDRAALTRALAAERRTVRVALALTMRSTGGLLVDTFASTAQLRPAVALRTSMTYFRRHGVSSDLRVWNIVKPLFSSVSLIPRVRLCRILGNTEWVPAAIKPDFCITLYHAFHNISRYHTQIVLRDLSKLLPECDESMESILLQMLDDYADNDIKDIAYPTIFVRYLLLSRNEEDVEKRFVKIGNKFLNCLDDLRFANDRFFERALNPTLESLKYNSAFLDLKYPSCLFVIEKILSWLQKLKSNKEYFKINAQVHLTMLYFKAVRQSMKQKPEVFADLKRRKSEGVEVVGVNFGKYIVNHVVKLVSIYFDSIIELYSDALGHYLNSNLMYGNSRNIFIGFVLKGILSEAVGIQRRVAVYILREHELGIEDTVRKEIEELIMKDRCVELFAYAELSQFSRVVPYRYNNW